MCGRFILTDSGEGLMEQLGLTELPNDYGPRYNIAPGQPILAARDGDAGRLPAMLRWGLVPRWASDEKIGNKMINARSETVGEKPSFRHAFHTQRCIIPADGFYEWQKKGGKSWPTLFRLADWSIFAFAGLWEGWKRPDGTSLFTCTILTTDANEVVRPVHHRMPVMLDRQGIDEWLDRQSSGDDVKHLLKAFSAEQMEAHPVSTRVNSPAHDDIACLESIQRGETNDQD